MSEKSHPDDEEVVASLRQKLSKTETAFEFFRPEEITDWHSDGVYKNLIDFEKDLAGICSLVLIVLESAGAIAELGAFSQIEDMKQKMMVISSSEIKEKNSFIELGVLRHLVDANSGSVRKYPWDMCEARGVFVSVEDEVVDDILSDVNVQLKEIPKSPSFKAVSNDHVMVLIYSLVKSFVALKLNEIAAYLGFFSVLLTEDNLKRKLFLMGRFRLIGKDTYSDSTYYYVMSEDFHRMAFRHKKGAPVDDLRLNVDCLKFYKSAGDRHRLGLLRKIKFKVDSDD